MSTSDPLFENNRRWARTMLSVDPAYFSRLVAQQSPHYLWIGCSDSRVPANQIVDLPPGDVFVHRNIAGLVQSGDLNCMAVIQYAVEIVGVKQIIVCGHYGCNGVRAALEDRALGLLDYWVWSIKRYTKKHEKLLAGRSLEQQHDMLCELNVLEQTVNLAQTKTVRESWQRGEGVTVHGWIYSVADGLLRDLQMTLTSSSQAGECYQQAMAALRERYL